MPATLGDHRGIIKAAVTVVNRAANKGSRGKKGRQRGGVEWGIVSSLSLLLFGVPTVTFLDGGISKYS